MSLPPAARFLVRSATVVVALGFLIFYVLYAMGYVRIFSDADPAFALHPSEGGAQMTSNANAAVVLSGSKSRVLASSPSAANTAAPTPPANGSNVVFSSSKTWNGNFIFTGSAVPVANLTLDDLSPPKDSPVKPGWIIEIGASMSPTILSSPKSMPIFPVPAKRASFPTGRFVLNEKNQLVPLDPKTIDTSGVRLQLFWHLSAGDSIIPISAGPFTPAAAPAPAAPGANSGSIPIADPLLKKNAATVTAQGVVAKPVEVKNPWLGEDGYVHASPENNIVLSGSKVGVISTPLQNMVEHVLGSPAAPAPIATMPPPTAQPNPVSTPRSTSNLTVADLSPPSAINLKPGTLIEIGEAHISYTVLRLSAESRVVPALRSSYPPGLYRVNNSGGLVPLPVANATIGLGASTHASWYLYSRVEVPAGITLSVVPNLLVPILVGVPLSSVAPPAKPATDNGTTTNAASPPSSATQP